VPCKGPITENIGRKTPGSEATCINSAGTVEDAYNGREDEEIALATHSLAKGHCHLK
jgi:hypothetical protein